MIDVLVVFGTRPEAIKMAPVVRALRARTGDVRVRVCVTGQHRELLDQVLDLFAIVPDRDLQVMRPSQDLFDVTTSILHGMRDVLREERPQLVLVHGDTTTAMATALAAFYERVPVGHVEAGLRTNNIYSPWPEEVNRQVVGRIAALHFAPTAWSRDNLLAERVPAERVEVTGNTVIDALQIVLREIADRPGVHARVSAGLAAAGLPESLVEAWERGARRLVLVTGHRRENFGQGFISVCEAIRAVASRHPDVDFVYPMHLNPNVRAAIREVFGPDFRSRGDMENVWFVEPLEYAPFVALLGSSYFVLTDSGGIQEEAPGLAKPVLVMRDTTERPEAVDAGTVRLVGTDRQRIEDEMEELLTGGARYLAMAKAVNPYGDGRAASRIADRITRSAEWRR